MKRASSKYYLGLNAAIDELHRADGRMLKLHTSSGFEWFILPIGRRVTAMLAAQIAKRPDIVAGKDDLFPHMSVTWRRLT